MAFGLEPQFFFQVGLAEIDDLSAIASGAFRPGLHVCPTLW
jgi:hypothetical protein